MAPDPQPAPAPQTDGDVDMQPADRPKRFKRPGGPSGSPAKKPKSARAGGAARGKDPVRRRAAATEPTADQVARRRKTELAHFWVCGKIHHTMLSNTHSPLDQNCLYGVIRLLLYMIDQKTLPTPPLPTVLKEWAGQTPEFEAGADVIPLAEENLKANKELLAKVEDVKAQAAFTNSRTVKFIGRIPDLELAAIFYGLGRIGLSRFAPDILSNNPELAYNLAHEQYAIKVFLSLVRTQTFGGQVKQSAVNFLYPDLVQHYRDYVFNTVRSRLTLETNQPGVYSLHVDTVVLYRRRRQVSQSLGLCDLI